MNPVWRFYIYATGRHFFTAAAGEKDILQEQPTIYRFESSVFEATDLKSGS